MKNTKTEESIKNVNDDFQLRKKALKFLEKKKKFKKLFQLVNVPRKNLSFQSKSARNESLTSPPKTKFGYLGKHAGFWLPLSQSRNSYVHP